MLLKGHGYEAFFLTVIGGLFVCVLTTVLLPVMLFLLPFIYENIHSYIHIILVFVAFWMILSEKGINRLYALFIFLFAGIFGLITLNTLSSEKVLFPALSGLFGISALAISLMSRTVIPPQEITEDINCNYAKATLASWLSGMFVGLLPGIGSAQAGIISSQVFRNKTKEFLVTLGGINTANMFFTLIIFYSLGKTRSGASWALSQITDNLAFSDILLISFTCLFSCFLSVILTLKLGKAMIRNLQRISYNRITAAIIIIIISMVLVLTGYAGLVILFTGSCLGIFDILLGLK
jgi:putative membrane protein